MATVGSVVRRRTLAALTAIMPAVRPDNLLIAPGRANQAFGSHDREDLFFGEDLMQL
jgi:hypothetical protein